MTGRDRAVWLVGLADRAAAHLCRQGRSCHLEQEDVRQDLLLDLLSRLHAYDLSRGTLQTFVSVCFKHRSACILRTAYRERVTRHFVELDGPVVKGGTTCVIDTLGESEGFGAWVGQPTDLLLQLEQQLDLDRVLSRLPAEMTPLCAVRMGDQLPGGLTASGSRTTLHRRLQDLRARLAVTLLDRPRPRRTRVAIISSTTAAPGLSK